MSTDTNFPRINSPKISEVIYDILREKIVSHEIPQGERLDLYEIEKRLGVSRTPLKEALNRLEMEGLIQIFPRSGTYVTNANVEYIIESFDLRRILELYAVELIGTEAKEESLIELKKIVDEMGVLAKHPEMELAYPQYLKLDHEFHRKLVALSGNQRLRDAHERENLHAQMARIRYRSYERELDVAQEEHERIMQAFLARDPILVANILDAHLQRAKRSLLNDMVTTFPQTHS